MPGKTLDQLEGVVWGEPTFDSYLVTTCHRLRTKPVDEFSVEDLRIMIGQKIGLPHLVPLAIAVLDREPLAEGDFYPGDLLTKVIGAVEWLQSNPEWLARVIRVTERALTELMEAADRELRLQLAEFLSRVRANG
jgi:CDI immunity proteins